MIHLDRVTKIYGTKVAVFGPASRYVLSFALAIRAEMPDQNLPEMDGRPLGTGALPRRGPFREGGAEAECARPGGHGRVGRRGYFFRL